MQSPHNDSFSKGEETHFGCNIWKQFCYQESVFPNLFSLFLFQKVLFSISFLTRIFSFLKIVFTFFFYKKVLFSIFFFPFLIRKFSFKIVFTFTWQESFVFYFCLTSFEAGSGGWVSELQSSFSLSPPPSYCLPGLASVGGAWVRASVGLQVTRPTDSIFDL